MADLAHNHGRGKKKEIVTTEMGVVPRERRKGKKKACLFFYMKYAR